MRGGAGVRDAVWVGCPRPPATVWRAWSWTACRWPPSCCCTPAHLYVGKAARPHGTASLAAGGFVPGAEAVIVEDVVTGAGQVLASLAALRALGLVVRHAVCVIHREEGGARYSPATRRARSATSAASPAVPATYASGPP
jgi:orotate phosphoribosyltransferase